MEHEKLVLTETDRRQFRILRTRGVLVEFSPNLLPPHDGIIPIVCSDCDQYADLEPRIAAMSRTSDGRTRPHALKLNGGGLLISTEALNHEDHEDRVLLKHVIKAQSMKGIKIVVLLGHAPCGAAYEVGMDLEMVVDRLIAAEDIVHECIGNETPTCIPLHMDFGGGPSNKGLFRINRREWQMYNRRGY